MKETIGSIWESIWVVLMWPFIPIIVPFMLFSLWAAQKGMNNRFASDSNFLNYDNDNIQSNSTSIAQDSQETASDL